MSLCLFAGAAALAAIFLSTAAAADDPNDPSMRDPRARARDRAIIRQLNLDELARVRARDARYAEGRRTNVSRYQSDRAQYERDMAPWRQAVDRCRAGDYRYCDR